VLILLVLGTAINRCSWHNIWLIKRIYYSHQNNSFIEVCFVIMLLRDMMYHYVFCRLGDRIASVNGISFTNVHHATAISVLRDSGQTATLVYLRDFSHARN